MPLKCHKMQSLQSAFPIGSKYVQFDYAFQKYCTASGVMTLQVLLTCISAIGALVLVVWLHRLIYRPLRIRRLIYYEIRGVHYSEIPSGLCASWYDLCFGPMKPQRRRCSEIESETSSEGLAVRTEHGHPLEKARSLSGMLPSRRRSWDLEPISPIRVS